MKKWSVATLNLASQLLQQYKYNKLLSDIIYLQFLLPCSIIKFYYKSQPKRHKANTSSTTDCLKS